MKARLKSEAGFCRNREQRISDRHSGHDSRSPRGTPVLVIAVATTAVSPLPRMDIIGGFLLIVGMASGAAVYLSVSATYILIATGLYSLMLGVLNHAWQRADACSRPRRGFGWANRVTLLRSLPVVLIASLVPFPEAITDHAWGLAWLSLGTLILDGVDGKVARATGSSSTFGSRFDMELDSFFTLSLCLVLISAGKAGTWVLALGLIRYGFVLAGHFRPWLQNPLPDSFRRKTVCVWQVATLLVCLLPLVSFELASAALALALALLLYSFAVDIVWLLRQQPVRHNNPLPAGDS